MLALEYCKRIMECIEKIRDTQMDSISQAANEIAVRLEKGGLFCLFIKLPFRLCILCRAFINSKKGFFEQKSFAKGYAWIDTFS